MTQSQKRRVSIVSISLPKVPPILGPGKWRAVALARKQAASGGVRRQNIVEKSK
jgi:hypothetical protein